MMLKLARFMRSTRGSVAVTAAVAIPVLIGFVALVAEFGNGLLDKSENQRIADQAAFAAAVNYAATSSTTSMTAVAQNVAVLNGLAATTTTASLVTSPRTATNKAVSVTVTTNSALVLAPVLGFGNSVAISTNAYAEMASTTGTGCILALNASGTGITLSGSGNISASTCTVASNASLSVPCGTFITAKTINYNGSAPSQGCSGITGTITKAASTDPLSSNAAVTAAAARATSAASISAPTLPTIPSGSDVTFDWSGSATSAVAGAGCSASFASWPSYTWTVTCPANGTYNFGNITLGGGLNLSFNTSGTSSTTYNFSGQITNTGSTMTFGPGTFNIKKGLYTGGGSTTTFGAGTFNIGQGTTACYDGANYSICHTGSTLTFGGPSTFSLPAGIYNTGGETLSMGSGTTNSFNIGPSTNGYALNIGGGATTTLADATGSSSVFELAGNFSEQGGSCTILSAATYHDIKGSMNVMGGLTLGAGLYAVGGYFGAGSSYGGDVWCNGTNVGVSGSAVTIAVAGNSTILGGSCNGLVFCVSSGFGHVNLSSPTSGTFANVELVGPTSTSVTAGAAIAEGATNTSVGGAFYFPNGPLTISGAGGLGNSSGQCLQVVASQITISGSGATSASQCFGSSSSSSSNVALVQ